MQKSMMMEFPLEEYEARMEKLVTGMQRRGMDAILLSSKEGTRYFAGLQSIVWDRSPSRGCWWSPPTANPQSSAPPATSPP